MANGKKNTSLEEKVVALAEQLGRIVGTVQAKTEGWLDRKALRTQMASIRDGAADVLEHLAGSAKRARSAEHDAAAARASASATARGRSGGKVDAPGKQHRKPVPNAAGVKKSDTRIAKLRAGKEARLRSQG